MLFKKPKIALWTVLLFFLFIILFLLSLHTLISSPSIQRYLLARLSMAIGYELHAKKIDISFWKGVGIRASELDLISLTGNAKMQVSRIRIALNVSELIKGHFVPTRLTVVGPQIQLDGPFGSKDSSVRKKAGLQTLKEFIGNFQKSYIRILSMFPIMSVERGEISFNRVPFALEAIDFNVTRKSEDPIQLDVVLNGRIRHLQEKTELKIRGTLIQDTGTRKHPFVEATFKTSGIPLTWIKWPKSFPVKKGNAEISGKFWGPLDGPLSANGKIITHDLTFLIDHNKKQKSFSFDPLTLDLDAFYAETILQIPSFHLQSDNFSITARSKLDLGDPAGPHLSLNAKAPFMPLEVFKKIFPSPLLPVWLERRLFPLFTGGDVRVDLFSLNGRLNQIENLNLPENASVLAMRLTCKNLQALNKEASLPFSGVSGIVQVEKGVLRVSDVVAGFGKSTIRNGSLNVSTLYDDAPAFDIFMRGEFSLQDLLRQKKMDLIPISVQRRFVGFQSAYGRLKAEIRATYKDATKFFRLQKASFQFDDCLIKHRQLFFPLFLSKAEILIEGETKRRFHGLGRWGKSKIQLSGSLGSSFQIVKAQVVARADVNEIMNFFYPDRRFPVTFQTPVSLQFAVSKSKDLWTSRGEMDLNGLALEASSFSISPVKKSGKIFFNIEFSPDQKIKFRHLKLDRGSSSLKLVGSYDLKGKDALNLKMSSKRLAWKDLGIRLKNENRLVAGVMAFDLGLNISQKKPENTQVNGEMTAQGLSLHSPFLPGPLSDGRFQLKFSGKETKIQSMQMRVGGNEIQIHGILNGWDRLNGELSLSTDHLDLSDWELIRTAGSVKYTDSGFSRFIDRSDLRVKLNLLSGQWETFQYGPAKVEGMIRSGDIYVSRSDIQWANGTLNLSGHIKRGKVPETSLSCYVKLTKQPLKALPKRLGGIKAKIDGLVTAEGFFFAKGAKKEDLISGLNGGLNILIENGRIKKSHVIFKILDFLSLKKLFKDRPAALSTGELHFDTLKGHIAIHNGLLKTDNLIMKSPIFNGISRGKMDLITLRVDAEVGVQPLGTIDFLISHIPIVGYILTGKEKSLLVYYFKVEGILPTPDVRYVPLEKLGKNTFDFFKRLFFTPGRIFMNISKIARELSGEKDPEPAFRKDPEPDQMGP